MVNAQKIPIPAKALSVKAGTVFGLHSLLRGLLNMIVTPEHGLVLHARMFQMAPQYPRSANNEPTNAGSFRILSYVSAVARIVIPETERLSAF